MNLPPGCNQTDLDARATAADCCSGCGATRGEVCDCGPREPVEEPEYSDAPIGTAERASDVFARMMRAKRFQEEGKHGK